MQRTTYSLMKPTERAALLSRDPRQFRASRGEHQRRVAELERKLAACRNHAEYHRVRGELLAELGAA